MMTSAMLYGCVNTPWKLGVTMALALAFSFWRDIIILHLLAFILAFVWHYSDQLDFILSLSPLRWPKSGGSGQGKKMSLLRCVGGYCYTPAAHWFLLFLYTLSRNVLHWRKTVLAEDGKQSAFLFICLQHYHEKKRWRRQRLRGRSWVTSWSLQSPAKQPCQDTSWRAVVALNQYFPPSRPGLFHWPTFKSGRVLNE